MKHLIVVVLLFIVSFTKGQDLYKCNNGDTEYDIYISNYPQELIISVDIDDVGVMGEIAVFDTLHNVLYSKTSEDTRTSIKKTTLMGNTYIYVSYRSKHYVIRKKYTIE